MRVAVFAGSVIAAFLLGLVPANAGTRVALVIGNSAYQNVPFLPNPVNDANDLSASLKRLDFDVRTLTNAHYDEMRRALIDFGQQARGTEIALIFFAGHGIQIGGENWLVPVEAQLATDLNVANETIGLQSLTRAVSNTSKLGLVILDACRSNPFLPKMQSTNLSRAVERGFSRVEPSDNVLVAYAARDGTTASDGSGRNSPFTSSLLKNIEMPGLEITFLFRNVRDDVMAATKREQQPFVYGSLSKDFIYLKAPVEAGTGTGSSPDAMLWEATRSLKDRVVFEQFLKVYPDSPFASQARARLDELGKDQVAVIAPPAGPSGPLVEREREAEIKLNSRSPLQGAMVSNTSPALAREFQLRTDAEGVVVTKVPDGTTAASAGFQKGDVILIVNNQKIAKTYDLERALREWSRLWRITVVRGGQQISVTLGG